MRNGTGFETVNEARSGAAVLVWLRRILTGSPTSTAVATAAPNEARLTSTEGVDPHSPEIELFDAVVRRSPWVFQVPLFSVSGEPLRRLTGGELETGEVLTLAAMTGGRAERNAAWARQYAKQSPGGLAH